MSRAIRYCNAVWATWMSLTDSLVVRLSRPRSVVVFLASLCVVFAGCGPELDSISQLNSLRIIGLRKSAPYARPGETIDLELSWDDAGRAKARPVQRFIGFWCVNPPGDLFGQCLAQPPNVPPQFAVDQDRFSIRLPNDMLRSNPASPELPPYGVAFVFYGVCAGRLSVAGRLLEFGQAGAGGATGGFGAGGEGFQGLIPDDGAVIPTCLDEQGNELGSRDFVVGYSAIYAYENIRNENPKITGFRVAGRDVSVDCVDSDCTTRSFDPPTGCSGDVACLRACSDGGAAACPEIPIQPIIDRASVERDQVAKVAYGNDLEESIWVSYLVDRGVPEAEVRLVNDANSGWNEDYGTSLFAPRKKGPLRIWAVVRDNRGGVAWVRVPAFVQ